MGGRARRRRGLVLGAGGVLGAAWTIGADSDPRPAGRLPTSARSTSRTFRLPHRSCSSATAVSSARCRFASSAVNAAESIERKSISIQASNGIELTDVPPPTRPTLKVVFGSPGT